jgi:hypothetical protein
MGILETYSRLSEYLGKEVEKRKNLIFVEDSKTQIYKIAWLKLNDKYLTKDNFEEIFDKECSFCFHPKGGRDNLRRFLDMPEVEEFKNHKIIGILILTRDLVILKD